MTDGSTTKRALLAIQQLQSKLEALEAEKHQPIAIVGMGCRFPGADTLDDFWTLLHAGKDAITEIPGDRWNLDQYYSPDPSAPGKMYTRHGGFVPHLHDFDAAFFRIAPREAASLDPQQRLLLEVSWEALEQAGIAPHSLMGQAVGVFVGICGIDYWHQLLQQDPSSIDAYLTTGNTHSTASGRLSYLLGSTGPSLSIDAACASSLVAVHLACQSLRQRECDLAIVGGVNRILSPEMMVNFCKAKMLSATGRCHSFDASADGFVRSEGCGVVVLKRLDDALGDRDSVTAVILGSATNHDGRSSGLTVPNGLAQQAVIRQALRQSRLEPQQISYLEAHGTGTVLGDSIELEALGQVFGDAGTDLANRPDPLWIGSVKPNIGHLEAASGIAGLIKVALSLQHQTLPPHPHLHQPNPQINWDKLPLKVPTVPTAWAAPRRIAGVNAFGFSGANAHVVLAEAPPPSPVALVPFPLHLFTLSARSEPALSQLIERYLSHLQRHPDLSLADLCWTANTGRSPLPSRLAILAQSLPDLLTKLTFALQGEAAAEIYQGRFAKRSVPESPSALPPVHLHFSAAPRPSDTTTLYLSPEQAQTQLPQMATWFIQGHNLHWHDGDRCYFQKKVALPTYPFQRQHFAPVPPR
ncbi:MAG: polyketide synthase [Cyanobacteria bacterium J069]|nr:MAG: polyketide synthase [Cyanobacteria bacterium J069]